MIELTELSTFQAVDIRVGTVRTAEHFAAARNPALLLRIDFGPELGTRKSSAQITQNYQPEELIGSQVLAVVNFPPRQIGPIMSEVLVLGVTDPNGAITLIRPEHPVENGQRLH